MKEYAVKNSFGDDWYSGKYGNARIVRVSQKKWYVYFWEIDATRAEEKIEYKTKKKAILYSIEWVTRGYF
jgi:hypothetical protein